MQPRTAGYEQSDGGIPADTRLMTVQGPVAVQNLAAGTHVYVLDISTGRATLQPIEAIESFAYNGPLAHLNARRIDLRLHPDVRLPYRTRSIDTVRFQRAADLETRNEYHLVNEWQTTPGEALETVDVTDLTDAYQVAVLIDCHGHSFRAALPEGCEPIGRNEVTGYHFDAETFKQHQDVLEFLATEVYIRDSKNHWRRPYRFDAEDFIRFIGWFVTEGSITPKTNRDSITIKIAQETPKYRHRLESLFDRMEIDVSDSERGYAFGSKVYARLLTQLCGDKSHSKHLPSFTWELCSDQQELLLDILIDGDGNDYNVFYTASDHLAADVMRLAVEVGKKPRYNRQPGYWEFHLRHVNDQFHPDYQLSTVQGDNTLHRVTIAEHSVALIGRNGKFQWVETQGSV